MASKLPVEVREGFTALARTSGAQKRNLILDASDPQALVRSLPTQELYYTIKDIGLADSGEVVALASAEQVAGCLDLDCWSKDRLDLGRLHGWLRFFTAGEKEAAEAVWKGADPEALLLAFRSLVGVHELVEGELPESAVGELVRTPDGFYALEVIPPPDAPENPLARALIDRVVGMGFAAAHAFMESVRWELPSALEEQAYQFRAGRLEDLGLPDYYEALSIFQPVRPDEGGERPPVPPPLCEELGAVLPERWSADSGGTGLLRRSMEELADTETLDELKGGLALLANRTVVAERKEPSSRGVVGEALRAVVANIEIGMQTLGVSRAREGAAVLAKRDLGWLHRLGFTQLRRLGQRAREMERSGRYSLVDGELSLLDSPHREMARALRLPIPRFVAVDDPEVMGIQRRFESIADVQAAEEELDFLAELPDLVAEVFGAEPASVGALGKSVVAAPADLRDVRFSTLFLTGLARSAARREAEHLPLGMGAIIAFLQSAREQTATPTTRSAFLEAIGCRLAGPGSPGIPLKVAERYTEICWGILESQTRDLALDGEQIHSMFGRAFLVGWS